MPAAVPRALAIRYVTVAEGERAAYLTRLAERTTGARACGYHVWAFEQEDTAGRFVEFVEAEGRAALATALTQDELLEESLDFRVPPAPANPAARPRFDVFVERRAE